MNEEGLKYMQGMMRSAQQHVEEPVLACGLFTSSGGMTALGVGKVSPLAGMFVKSAGKKKAAGYPSNVMVTITPSKVHIFSFKHKRSGAEVKQPVDVWDRSTMRVSTEDKATVIRVHVELPEESRALELDATKSPSGVNEEVVRILAGAGE